MMTALHIEGFRAHEELHLYDLAPVNLLVGRNNGGKSSVLDAVEVLARDGDPLALDALLMRRGGSERWRPEDDHLGSNVVHLFYGHEAPGQFALHSEGASPRSVAVQLTPRGDSARELRGTLRISHDGGHGDRSAVEVGFGGFHLVPNNEVFRAIPVRFVQPHLARAADLKRDWDELVGNPDEDRVIDALQLIEPRIRRVVFTQKDPGDPQIFVLLDGDNQRVPMSTLGDAVRRVFAIAIHALSAEGGVLLLDEVEAGVHFSGMQRLWRWLIEYAHRTHTQVFATTHSRDCVDALAFGLEERAYGEGAAALYRIDAGKTHPARYGLDELVVAAEHHLEVRG
jgi:hypothetical protein